MGESAGQLELVDSRIDLRLADSAEYGGRDSGNDAYPSIQPYAARTSQRMSAI
jgi:hypothetical protein